MRKSKVEDSSGGSNWMDTYGDMVTLLLTFFVMLYSMSSIDSNKWQMIASALASTSNKEQLVVTPNPDKIPEGDQLIGSNGLDDGLDDSEKPEDNIIDFDDLYYYLKKYVSENNLEQSVDINKGENFTFITFRNNIFFDGDSSVLKNEGKKILDALAKGIKPIADQVGELRTYGHTARGGGKDEPNNMYIDRKLSSDRAMNVLLYIQSKGIIPAKKMVHEGYGENWPIVPHDGTEATRIKNRRVEIYIAKSDIVNNTLDEIYKEINK